MHAHTRIDARVSTYRRAIAFCPFDDARYARIRCKFSPPPSLALPLLICGSPSARMSKSAHTRKPLRCLVELSAFGGVRVRECWFGASMGLHACVDACVRACLLAGECRGSTGTLVVLNGRDAPVATCVYVCAIGRPRGLRCDMDLAHTRGALDSAIRSHVRDRCRRRHLRHRRLRRQVPRRRVGEHRQR
jgi:hypothetical protein